MFNRNVVGSGDKLTARKIRSKSQVCRCCRVDNRPDSGARATTVYARVRASALYRYIFPRALYYMEYRAIDARARARFMPPARRRNSLWCSSRAPAEMPLNGARGVYANGEMAFEAAAITLECGLALSFARALKNCRGGNESIRLRTGSNVTHEIQ